jgi:hypothetical protein
MKQVFRISLTVAATALVVGLTFSSAKADRITNIERRTLPVSFSSGIFSLDTTSLEGAYFETASGNFGVVAAKAASASSIVSASAKKGPTFQASGTEDPPVPKAPAVPELTTMLLFGTGLVGTAGILRRRLRSRRSESR